MSVDTIFPCVNSLSAFIIRTPVPTEKAELVFVSPDVWAPAALITWYKRVSKLDSRISIATIYRTVKLFEESGILTKHDFKGGKARYETIVESHHDHLIDIKSGEIIEFVDEEIEKLQKKVAEKYGYKLVDHKLELYGIKKLDEK